jgi:hypothetical protein
MKIVDSSSSLLHHLLSAHTISKPAVTALAAGMGM